MKKISIEVNGKKVKKEVPDHTILSVLLRDVLNLTGTHVGCDTSQCGACVVHVNKKAVKSCTMLAVAANGFNVETIEGVGQEDLHPMQLAFKENHGLQCGFCTPGMIMTAIDMVARYNSIGKELNEAAIRKELEGNICRCTGYHNIIKSIQDGAFKMSNA